MKNGTEFEVHWSNNKYPFIAILRGLTVEHAIPVCSGLIDKGIKYIEVPLNTDYAYEVIELLIKEFGNQATIGAGTVLKIEQVQKIKDIGGEIIISPNLNEDVVRKTKDLQMISCPGVYTVTEAFNAIEYGADILKFYPADMITPKVLSAMLTVLPKKGLYFPVGGISADSNQLNAYIESGANGFGIGGSLYKPTMSVEEVLKNADKLIDAWNNR
ncbi:2-dehydro-3-deoxy-6-phosphogalactonate aldolase [Providencia huaxiensis]|uniref:2-dehydro-3-deoxy-6-phosphogalactonate aldolase n=2 Tax=Providencia TaxID=586 RepID=A0AA42FSN3_9GAMM|nr:MULTISPECIES: 2-dehydro-3-deoxy-6-phosphogalactonate aldolase [Providencia]MBC8655061.1 2-dehydro-3-deoxy-6-phosphogalactonate aldolase [Providencia vermicola]EIL1983847.1 2-dehydro-3-deoxy-6-phosphogalactonate aldolase [Providencia rettgeri]EIU9515134.1 2-dehydro-3-deoxy-6-phosphogalactonate aldolase [Providencia rettgeri]EJD6399196.1 2-dehydro-3-deoxy-6-phosphogalactonate aldolase [Providencia rettgeri]EJD6409548.1 2-dehydro-3-deoxy-6-phosphogalactonate aldolase [Providencia rettgeri]